MAVSVQQQNKFINEITPYILKYAPKYNILCPGIVIVQAIKESGYGISYKASKNNFFGLKYRPNRCPTSNGTFVDGGSEQRPDGSYVPIKDQWFQFPDMEAGVQGYFDFTNISNYKALKGEKDGYKYLQALKNASYFTSLTYVDTAYALYKEKKLDEFDRKYQEKLGITKPVAEVRTSANSPLVTYTNISKNKTSPRNHKIDTITIHCYVGQVTAKQGCDMFATTNRKASCNYVVGRDGSIGLCVEEKDRSWCSSNAANDNRAITIEVASDSIHPYAVTDAALNALINLCADICKRNGIKKLLWKGDKSLIGQVDKQNMTVHRWFAAKACPGDYLYNLHGEIANKVNAKLGVMPILPEKTPENSGQIPVSNNTGDNFITYIIQRGDTLNKIAKLFSSNVQIIAADNNIKDVNKIITGTKIKIRTQGQMTVKTKGSNLRIRKEPNTNCLILGNIANGQKVNILEKTNEAWYKVEFNGVIGYCSTSYLI